MTSIVKYLNKFWFRMTLFLTYIISIWLIFSGVYYYLHKEGIDFSEFNDTVDPYYFSCITMSSTGYGDITPKSRIGKIMVCLQIFLFWSSVLTFTILSLEFDIIKPKFRRHKR